MAAASALAVWLSLCPQSVVHPEGVATGLLPSGLLRGDLAGQTPAGCSCKQTLCTCDGNLVPVRVATAPMEGLRCF